MDRVDPSILPSSEEAVLLDLVDSEPGEDRWPMGWTIWFALGVGAALWLVIAAIIMII